MPSKMLLKVLSIVFFCVSNPAAAEETTAPPPSRLQEASKYATVTTVFSLVANTFRHRDYRLGASNTVIVEKGSDSDLFDAAVMVGPSFKLPIRDALSVGAFWPTFIQTVSRTVEGQVAPVGFGIGAYYQPLSTTYSLHLGWFKTREKTLSAEGAAAEMAGAPIASGAPLTREIGASSFFIALGISP